MRNATFLFVACLLAVGTNLTAQQVEVLTFGSGYLGVEIRDVTEEDVAELALEREAGVVVTAVQEDSPAERAALAEGDVILEFGGVPVLSVRHLQRLVADTPIGRDVELTVSRGTGRLSLAVTVEKRPGNGVFRLPGDAGRVLELMPELRRLPELRFGRPGRNFSEAFVSPGPRLGVAVQTMNDQFAEFLGSPPGKGLLIMEVDEDTPAQAAGLRAGDVILAIDGQAVTGTSELRQLLTPGTHELEVIRDHQSTTVQVELEESRSGRSSRTRRM